MAGSKPRRSQCGTASLVTRPKNYRPYRGTASELVALGSKLFRDTSLSTNGLSCSTCHNNTVVIGKPSNHFATTQECNFCHSTRAWVPANYNHSGYYPRHGWSMRCNSCHSSSPQSASNAYKTPAYAQSCAGCHYNDYLKEHSAGSIQSKKHCQNCHEHATSLTRGKW